MALSKHVHAAATYLLKMFKPIRYWRFRSLSAAWLGQPPASSAASGRDDGDDGTVRHDNALATPVISLPSCRSALPADCTVAAAAAEAAADATLGAAD